MKRLKIFHVVHSFSAGGLENGIVNIINNSPDHLEHELCLLTEAGNFLSRLSRDIVYHELHKDSGNSLAIIGKLAALYRKRRVDIIHTRNWAAFDGIIAVSLVPGIAAIHGEHGRDMSDPQGLVKRRNILRRAFAWRITQFVGVSADLCQWLVAVVGIPSKKICLIPNGVDTRRFHPARNQHFRAEFGIHEDEFIVGAVGRLDPVKNFSGLIRAVRLLAKSGTSTRLVIVGDGPERANLEREASSWPTAQTPVFAGYRNDTDQVYGAFDLFVQNSYAEGMSNTLLEAMACGLPIVCTPVGAAGDLVANRCSGIHVPPGNDEALVSALTEMIGEPSLRIGCGEAARHIVEKQYSLNLMIDKYCRLYSKAA